MIKKWRAVLLLLLIVLGGVGWRSVLAQEQGLNLITSPLPITLSAKPGESVSTELRVKNNNNTTERLRVDLLKFSSNDQGEVKLEEPGGSDMYFKWATLSPQTFDAQPGEWKTVKMTIALPKDAAFGYYYAVSFSRASQEADTSKTATIEGRVITFVLLEAESPNAKRELKISQFSADHSLYEFLPSTLSVAVKNSGNVHVAPRGNIFIKRGNKTVSTLEINAAKGNVLPNSTRTFTAQWKDGFPVYEPKTDGKSGETQLMWDLSQATKLRIGRYTAKLVLVYNDGQRDVPIEGEVSFWVIPWRLIFGIIAIPVIPAAVVSWLVRRRYKRKVNLRR